MKIPILGTGINTFCSLNEAVTAVFEYIKEKDQSVYITVNNVHTVIEAVLNDKYKEVLNNSFMAFADGKPLSIYGRLKGEKEMGRIFGPSFMEKALEAGQEKGIKHFFFGSSQNVLDSMEKQIHKKYPNAIISGMISPPYRKLTDDENQSFTNAINKVAPDIIWVGLGAPKQELWMYNNYKNINRGLLIGIGAGFDYLAGKTTHAPEWMKKFALEWLYRLIQEPKRLWKRYLVTNTLFLIYVAADLLKIKKF